MSLGAIITYNLSNLVIIEPSDHVGTNHQGKYERRENAENAPDSQILEYLKAGIKLRKIFSQK